MSHETNGEMLTEDVVEAPAEEAVETQTRDEALQQVIDERVEDSAPDESGETTEVETETVATEPVETPKPAEGPTAAMIAVAKQQLPAELVDTAVNDAQLTQWLNMANQRQPEAEQEPETETPAAFELSLPEDEFPADDPVRQALGKMQGHYEEKLTKLEGDMRSVVEIAQSIQHDQESAQQAAQRQVQNEFDSVLDGIGGSFGKASDVSDQTDVTYQMRSAAFNLVNTLQQSNPDATLADLTRQAATQMGLFTQPKNPQVIKKAAQQKLGGPTSPPVPTPPKDRVRGLQDIIDGFGKR